MNQSVTLRQIAEKVNKSVVTVSKALRDHPDISKKTRDEIKRIAAQLAYTPNLIARKLSSNATRSVGLIVPRIAHPFFSEAIEAIYDEAHHKSYDIIMMVTGENDELEAHHIQTLLSLQVDGFLISVSEKTKDTLVFQNILNKGKKLVFFDRVIIGFGCSCVVCDDYDGMYNLVSFVIKNGYKRIGYLSGFKDIYIGQQRRKGFEAALNDHGVPLQPEWMVEGGFDQQDGYDGFMKLYKNGSLPDLIVTVSYSAASGALKAIKELKLNIPKDIDIVAFGDSAYNTFIKPSLTVVRLAAREMGKRALELLLQQINTDEIVHETIVIPTQLIVNDTGFKPSG